MKIKFGDIVQDVKCNIDRENNPFEFYVAGDHLDSEDLTIRRRGRFSTDDVGPAFVRKFTAGQILYGSRRTYLKKVAVADFDGICANTTFVFESKNPSLFDQRLLPFLILSDNFTKWSISHSKGSTNPYILFSDLAEFEFDLPSLADQKKLADKLWATYRLKESYKKLLASMDELVKSRFMEQFIIGTPYERKSLGDYISQVRGVSYKPKDLRSSLSEDSVLLLRANNISSGVINHDEVQYVAKGKVSATQILQTGDILICASSGSLEHVGKAAICFSSIVGETFGAFCKLIRTNGALLPEYIAAYLKTDEYREIIMQLACGSNINNLKTEHIDNLQIPVPPIDVQESFVSFVRQLDKSKLELQKSIAAIDDVIKSLIN